MPKTARKRSGKKIALRLTRQDRELVLGFLIMDQYLEDRLKRTPSGQEEVFFTLEELRDFFGWFNAPGNQSWNSGDINIITGRIRVCLGGGFNCRYSRYDSSLRDRRRSTKSSSSASTRPVEWPEADGFGALGFQVDTDHRPLVTSTLVLVAVGGGDRPSVARAIAAGADYQEVHA